jgi:diadenosine tetraphosphatase ApaH/serine/threonine PP2A family protein phosphatase
MRSLVAQAVLGNHDAAVAGRMDYSYYYYAARQVLDKHAQMLDAKNMEWLKSLPYDYRENDILFCHGSPINIREFDYIFSREQATQCLGIWDDLPSLTVIGHSLLCKSFAINPDHPGAQEVVTLKFELRAGWKYIISVGSVGQPRDFDPRASYTIFDTETRTFEFKRVEYDTKATAMLQS